MCDSVIGMKVIVDCPECKGKKPNCSRCGGHGVIGISAPLMDKTPDRAPTKNPLDVSADLHRIPK